MAGLESSLLGGLISAPHGLSSFSRLARLVHMADGCIPRGPVERSMDERPHAASTTVYGPSKSQADEIQREGKY